MIKKCKKKILLFSLIMILLTIGGIYAEPSSEERINIYFTSSINGNLDGCECVAVPKSGLVCSAVFLRTVEKDNSIILDLGDFMDVYPDDLLAENILQVFDELKYDLLCQGDQEFTEGIDFLLGKSEVYPFVNNNMMINGKILTEEPVVFVKKGRKIGIGAIIDKQVFFFHPAEIKNALDIEEPESASERLLEEMEDYGIDVKVLLYHGPSEKAETIFNLHKGWDIVLYGHDQKLHSDYDGERRYIASPGDNGNRVGQVSLFFDDSGFTRVEGDFHHFDYMKDPMDPEVKERIDIYKKEMISRLQGERN